MKISDSTKDVLKNFASINPSISIKSGNVLRTVSEQKNILAQASVSESFPQDFAVYELNQFLGLVSLFEDPEIEFGSSSLVVAEGRSKSRYTYTDPSMVTTPPEKNIELPSVEVAFDMSKDEFRSVVNAAHQLGLPEVVVRGEDGHIKLVATDTKNPTSNEFDRVVGENGAEFQFIFKTENLKMIPADYSVEISSKGISMFKGENITYWIATEAGSSYNG